MGYKKWSSIKHRGTWPPRHGVTTIAAAYWLAVEQGWITEQEATDQDIVVVPIVDLRGRA